MKSIIAGVKPVLIKLVGLKMLVFWSLMIFAYRILNGCGHMDGYVEGGYCDSLFERGIIGNVVMYMFVVGCLVILCRVIEKGAVIKWGNKEIDTRTDMLKD